MRMLALAHADHGRRPWATLFEPAIRLAESGFPVSPRLHALIARDKHLKTFADTAGYFHRADGMPLAVGDRLRNPALADSLRRLAADGADALYDGPLANAIVQTVRSAPRNPAAMTAADLAGYEAVRRPAVCMPYRAWRLCGMPPPSSGGITTLQILGLLERFDMTDTAPESATFVHRLAEAGRLAFADRGAYIADPAFTAVPTAGLLDPAYLAARARAIGKRAIAEPAPAGRPPGVESTAEAEGSYIGGESTTHISVVDAFGNAVSLTSSIEGAFGSRLMVGGFLLNNQLTDFSFVPERDGVPVANRAEPGKRPRSSMAPTVVLDRDSGRLVAVLGSPGGSRIIGYVAKTLVAMLDGGMDIQSAIDSPHALNRNGATELEAGTAIADLRPALEARGHRVVVRPMASGIHGIVVTPTGLQGGADPRREGVALGD